ncbi:hypothetical protein [Pseudomonas fluorescens]|uniref:hypothetical protein n=1 Tax=Pseudomonas fluorescens TaxID=294 RepID=UPI00192B4B31|nr:hypothetical protein [Pseudomonas fluorescens]MBL4981457.1 hypothetical protein [Pseudomonas fluorescens]
MRMPFEGKMNFVYCDHGVIVEWLKGRKRATAAIEKLLKTGHQPVYSPAHIEEFAVPVQRSGLSEDVVMAELKKLSVLTKNFEILPNSRRGLRKIRTEGKFGAFLCKEHPKYCYERVIENYKPLNDRAEGGQQMFTTLANQEANGRVPGTVNRYDAQELLGRTPVKSSILGEYFSIFHNGHAYAKMATGISKQSPFIEVDDPQNSINLLKGNHDAVQAMIEAVIKCLIRERYYPDPIKKYRSEMHDITHAVYASYFNLYVIDDERSREKCKAAYKFLGVPTNVLSPEQVIETL